MDSLNPEHVFDGFCSGYCCSMQVFSYAAEKLGFDIKTASKIATGFCGGMGIGGICGCVSAAYMAIGLKYGCSEGRQPEQMEVFKQKKQVFNEWFKENFGSLNCPEVLGGLNPANPTDKASIMEKGLMREICAEAVCATCQFLEELLED